ncbi:MAG TPA: twin-arginine translocase TatA/TatE family subunit [Methylomirabilota bacterium]|jgi:TatA/E family protein of Tat protein translocase|nr:twin-arginine translocase TatA/TatE family subunit [Methylomirabilota bacterium]
MLDIGVQELLVIMVLALLVFGPERLPELGRRLGRAMREFRRASDEFRSTVEQNLQLNVDHDILPPPASPAGAPAGTEPAAGALVMASADAGLGAEGAPAAEALPASSDGAGAAEPAEPYWASRGGRLLHRRECSWRARIPGSERIPIKTATEGWDQGLRPCPVCEPRDELVAS